MLGLLTKDFRIMLSRKQFFLMVLVIGAMLSISGNGFVVAYLSILCALFTVSTISYDEYDNCYPFLMTMPIDATIYSVEKYVFGFITGLVAWIFGTGTVVISNLVRGEILSGDLFAEVIVYIPIFLWMISISIPLQLKFGAEKSRMVMVIAMAIGVFAFTALSNLGESMGVDSGAVQQSIMGISDQMFVVIAVVATVTVLAASILWSISIMKKKEF